MPPLPRLSVVTFTDGPVAMVAASLGHVREVADEIVVAVDARVDPDELGPLQAVADRLIRAEFVPPLEANLAWLHGQASGDWVLRLDSDDLVSEGLVRHLSTPGWDEGITHAYLQYRWLWGEGDAYLDQPPWAPDPVLRLFRNLPGITEFATGTHLLPTVAGHARLLDVELFHLDLVVCDEATRAAKAARYEYDSPGHRTDRGWSVSSTYYLPERAPRPPRTHPLAPVDAAAVDQVLAHLRSAAPPDPPVDGPELHHVVTATDRRTPAPATGDARIRVLGHGPLQLVAGRSAIVTVGVTNVSTRRWSPDDDPAEVVGGRFRDAAGHHVGHELRAVLPGPLPVGAEGLVRLPVPPGIPAEAHLLEVGLVQDGVAWHDATASVELHHQPGRRVLLSTGVSTFPHLGDDLITREVLAALARDLPDVVPVLLAHPTEGLTERFGCDVVPGPASLPTRAGRGEGVRRARDLVNQARLMAKGTVPSDPQVAAVLAPFAEADALVVAPGGGLASRYSAEALMVCVVQVLVARAFGLPVFVEGPSIGPIEMRRDHAAIAELLNDATRVTVRDPISAKVARRVGRAIDPAVVGDPATAALEHLGAGRSIARSWRRAQGIDDGRPYAVLSFRPWASDVRNVASLRAAMDALAAAPGDVAAVLVPHCSGDDDHDDRALLQADPALADRLAVWDPAIDVQAAVALIADATLSVGTRFHQSVLAAAAGVPAVALVADEYDRLRIRGHQRAGTVRVAELDDPAAVADAVTEALAGPAPEPGPRWVASDFTEALGGVLPPAPRLG